MDISSVLSKINNQSLYVSNQCFTAASIKLSSFSRLTGNLRNSASFTKSDTNKSKLRQFWIQHADSEDALNDWYKFASKAKWSNLLDVQKRYPKAEAVGNFTVFNIKGNNYRLIVDIKYSSQTIFIKYILTHAEYDKEK
jgi:mRNA interferase HigB